MDNDHENLSISFGPYVIDAAARELRREGKAVVIQSRVFDLLLCLARNHDRMVGKDELQDAVWSGRIVTEAALTRAVMKARKAVGDDVKRQAVIKTLHGRGYRFVAEITAVGGAETMDPGSARKPGHASSPADRRPGRRRKLALRIAAIILAVVFVTAFLHLLRRADTPTGTEYPPNSIAVLPFVNLSDDPTNEYFSDGISEELLNLLAKIPELRVVSRSSSFSYKGRDLDLPTIATQLGVAYVLNGSVRKAGNEVRVTTQLVDVHTDSPLWSETYDRTLDDIFAIQEDIAEMVVGQLKVTLLGSAPKVTKTTPEAYTLFLQAHQLGTRFTSDAFEQSIALYRQALEIDPGYAAAWSGLAMNHINQTLLSFQFMDEGIGLARAAARRALALDPEHAPAYAHLSIIALRFDLDPDAAAGYLERALKLEPSNPDILRQASVLDSSLGHLARAISVNQFVVGRDPVNPVSHYYLGLSHLWAGHLDEAISSFRTAMMLNPDHASAHYRIGTALYLKGEHEAALEEMRQERGVTKRLMGEVMMRHVLGETEASDAALAQLISEHEQTTAYNIAYLKAFRGEADDAFEWLDKAVQYHDTGLPQISYQPEFERIREDPRWLPFLESIGMAPDQLAAVEFEVTLPN